MFDVTIFCGLLLQGLKAMMGANLPDKGASLARWEQQIIDRITSIKGGDLTLMQHNMNRDDVEVKIALYFFAEPKIFFTSLDHCTKWGVGQEQNISSTVQASDQWCCGAVTLGHAEPSHTGD